MLCCMWSVMHCVRAHAHTLCSMHNLSWMKREFIIVGVFVVRSLDQRVLRYMLVGLSPSMFLRRSTGQVKLDIWHGCFAYISP